MYKTYRFVFPLAGLIFAVCSPSSAAIGKEPGLPWQAGLARVDITPIEPVRMAGYGSRDHPSEGTDTPLYVRCLALQSTDSADPAALLISVDTIGLPGSLTRELAHKIERQHGIPREQVVFCSTHTHCGPDLVSELSNIFSTQLSDVEVAAGKRYKQQLMDGTLQAVSLSLRQLAPAKLSYAVGEATFAANRRVLTNGRWTGFGVQPDGPVDHTVPVIRISDANGTVRGVVFNYACHCTTLGGDYYNINAEWAGYAATTLESAYPGAVALCTIGCGADANPEPRGALDAAKVHGLTLSTEVQFLVNGEMQTIDAPIATRFDYAALSFDLPTREELQERTKSSNPQAKRHAEQLLQVLERHGRLPATYPVPIQSWQFGDQLTMIFLGGEVVVDYALRLKKTLHDPQLWVTAYANDVLGYIASERIRNEGGYEYDRSGVYYGLPGPWATGSEDLLIERVQELLTSRGRSRPQSSDEALNSFKLTDGFRIELVAAEPLVQDPINIAFGADGRLWVVEMGDYPQGEDGGQIKTLVDTDGDGTFDQSHEFLSALPFPTGVFPWRDGVLISAAPDILFARDSNGDGKADDIQKLYTGFRLANPQHRINGFSYGMDHSLHLASGDNLGEITSMRTGETIDASGHDIQIWPDSGRIAVTSGRTQYVRSRNDWGEWFGSDNSRPMFHFPIEDRYLRRNSSVSYPGNVQQLFDPPVAPPVFPVTSAAERFNDLFAANRFTSACSAIIARSPYFSVGSDDVAFICEPVHNLVHRTSLSPVGATFHAERTEQESASEFLASSDPWFRPVRAAVGPRGMLYIVDMYREVIEHPEWIPDSWQQQLDLRAGSDRGRIYRIVSEEMSRTQSIGDKTSSAAELVGQLKSPIGPLRDLAQQRIIERNDHRATPLLSSLAEQSTHPFARVHALFILDIQQQLDTSVLSDALTDSHPGVLLVAIRIAESRLQSEPELIDRIAETAKHQDARVVMRSALALGQTKHPAAGKVLAKIACSPELDRWTARAVSCSSTHHASVIVFGLLQQANTAGGLSPASSNLLTELFVTMQAGDTDIVGELGDPFADSTADLSTKLELAASFAAALRPSKSKNDQIAKLFQPLYASAVTLLRDADTNEQQRCQALRLVGIGIDSAEKEKSLLLDLLAPATPVTVQLQAIDRLTTFSGSEPCKVLLDRWPSMSQALRDHCVARILERQPWTEMLLSAMESAAINVKDLSPAARQQLTQTGSRSMRVRAERLTRITGTAEKQSLVESYLDKLTGDADIDSGAALFKHHCAVCHVPNEHGQPVGASLNNLTDRSAQALVTAILDPNRAVDPKYQSYLIQTDDGRIFVGAIEEESGQSMTLAHADGRRTTIRRREIADMKNTGVSLMPEGLDKLLPPAALQDVIAYLQRM